MNRRRADYRSECFECGWVEFDAASTAPARRHNEQTGHHTACAVERDYHYRDVTSRNRTTGAAEAQQTPGGAEKSQELTTTNDR